MEFFDKKQDVIEIELTSYGKQLLSRGLFEPVYYTFSDDGVLYDQKWMSGTISAEPQWKTEPRIQENTPRLKTQYRKVGAEKGIYNWNTDYASFGATLDTFSELFEVSSYAAVWDIWSKSNLNVQFAESEKLLENILGTKSYFNSYNPAWNVLFYNGKIHTSSGFYKKNDIVKKIPQLNVKLTDKIYKLDSDVIPTQVLPEVKNLDLKFKGVEASLYEKVYFSEYNLDDGNVFIIQDFMFISLEEANSEITNDNFMIEVFEIIPKTDADDGEEELIKMQFPGDKNTVNDMVTDVFSIKVDKEIHEEFACTMLQSDEALKDQSLYIENVFDCEKVKAKTDTNQNPYTSLPEVVIGDDC